MAAGSGRRLEWGCLMETRREGVYFSSGTIEMLWGSS